jgi:hypothetical protein
VWLFLVYGRFASVPLLRGKSQRRSPDRHRTAQETQTTTPSHRVVSKPHQRGKIFRLVISPHAPRGPAKYYTPSRTWRGGSDGIGGIGGIRKDRGTHLGVPRSSSGDLAISLTPSTNGERATTKCPSPTELENIPNFANKRQNANTPTKQLGKPANRQRKGILSFQSFQANIPTRRTNYMSKKIAPKKRVRKPKLPEIRPVAWSPDYGVSADGRVWRLVPSNKNQHPQRQPPYPLTPIKNHGVGYLFVNLYTAQPDGSKKIRVVYVHKLVVETFLGPKPPDSEIHHLNFDKLDNRLKNLAYVEYGTHCVEHTDTRGAKTGRTRRKLTREHVREMLSLNMRPCDAKRKYGIGYSTAWAILNGTMWKHIWREYHPSENQS